MLLESPTKVSQGQITLDVREIEPLLQASRLDLKPWPGAMITLTDGRTMYIRGATLGEAPDMMRYMKRVMEADHDFYDEVGARLARGLRVGAIMYYAKASYAFEVPGNCEFWATYESYNGWHRWAWRSRPTPGRSHPPGQDHQRRSRTDARAHRSSQGAAREGHRRLRPGGAHHQGRLRGR